MRTKPEFPFLIGEDDYPEKMRGEVADWRRHHLHRGKLKTPDGAFLQYYYALCPEAKGSVVFLHGYCEFIGKYRELLYCFYQEGYHVFFHEQRGFGRSSRAKGVGMENVYIGSYKEYEADLKYLLDNKYLPLLETASFSSGREQSPLILFGHSMGGAVASLFLEDYPKYFDAAILSSPMHKMVMGDGKIPAWKVRSLLTYARISRKDKKPLPGSKGFHANAKVENSGSMSENRFFYVLQQRIHYPEYRTSDATYGWVRASLTAQKRIQKHARQIHVPVLLFQSGKDTLVYPEAQNAFVRRCRTARLIRFADAKHELMNAVPQIRVRYYQKIFAFLDRVRAHSQTR